MAAVLIKEKIQISFDPIDLNKNLKRSSGRYKRLRMPFSISNEREEYQQRQTDFVEG